MKFLHFLTPKATTSADTTSRSCDHLPDSASLCDPTNPNACAPCRNIFKIENSLRALRDTIVSLETQRQKLQTQAIQQHNPPIHRIPPEVAGEIFEWCIPNDIFDLNFRPTYSTSTFCSPLVISAVCRKWRDWAYSMPRLWNVLPFYTAAFSPRGLPDPDIVKQWINRAGQLPLSVTIHTPRYKPNDNLVLQVINVLNQYSSRWQTLSFSGRPEIFSHLSNRIQSLPEIRGLYLDCDSDFSIAGAEDDDDEFSSPLVDFPWERLTRLGLGMVNVFSFFKFLRVTPNVIKYSFELDNEYILDHTHFGPSTPIIHFHLRDLVDSTLYSDMEYLNHIQCPSLQSLTADNSIASCLDSLILPFLQRSQCALRILSLNFSSCLSASEMTSLCKEIPTLQTLDISADDWMLESVVKLFFLHLAEFSTVDGRQVPRYLPNLNSLSLHPVDDYSDWKILLDVFGCSTGQNPVNHRPTLKLIDILSEWDYALPLDCINSMDEDTLTRFLWLEESGVKWKLYSYTGDSTFMMWPKRRLNVTTRWR
ncbi:hypothetical protein BDN70DRAFT_936859 [Pholiota conissans]|uniref:F-box domain-containing protein n=1 Tax=Pholiota conissans TaxID=109636 RepID=A0A9P5YRK1_9AGAR|nr:hypothetical protein BDN70DRAFT_936859 [Pholiota conissans]